MSFTFLLSIFAVTHARASCLNLASSALTSDGVLKSSALDQASVSCTSKAAWTCASMTALMALSRCRVDGVSVASGPARPLTPRRRHRDVQSMARVWRRRRALCVRRATAARGAPSWLGSDTVARAFCFMSDGTLAPAARVARCWGCNVWGWARGRAAAALFWTSGARAAAAAFGEVMAHLRPWSSRCEHVKAASAAFTHEPCSCGSPAPRLGSGVAPAATSTRCSSEALYGSGAAGVAFRPAPLHRGSAH